MNNTTIVNIFNNDNSNYAYIKTQHYQIMAIIAYRIFKLEFMIKKPSVANHTFFNSITFSRINPFAYINFIVIQYCKI